MCFDLCLVYAGDVAEQSALTSSHLMGNICIALPHTAQATPIKNQFSVGKEYEGYLH